MRPPNKTSQKAKGFTWRMVSSTCLFSFIFGSKEIPSSNRQPVFFLFFFYSYHRNNSIYFAFDIPVAPDDSVNSSSSEFTASFEYTVPTKLPITLHFVFLFLFSSCCCRVAAAAAWDYLCMHLFKFNSDRRWYTSVSFYLVSSRLLSTATSVQGGK
jgi:hypothetical protein